MAQQVLPPVDIIKNVEKLLNFITKDILQAFPILVAILTFILFAVVAFLMLIFQGGNIITP